MASGNDSGFSEYERVTFRGPANWFSFEVPAYLSLEQTEAFLEIKPRVESSSANVTGSEPSVGGGSKPAWNLTLYAAWVDLSEPQKSAASFEASALFPAVVTSQPVDPAELPGHCQTWAGMSKDVTSASIWRKILKPRKMYEWRLWVIEFREIMVVASLQSKVGLPLDEATVDTCTEIINSILFAESFARPPMLFREQVIDLARKHFPLLEIESQGSFSIRLDGAEINLSNFYRSYIHQPDRLSDIVLPGITALVRMQELGPEQLMPDLSEVSEKIMPMLYPQTEADESMKEFARISWVGGLSVMFVLDEDDSYRFVHNRMLTRWDITLEKLHEMAMKNLQAFADDNPLEVSVVGDEDSAQMLMPVNLSPYNSVRLLGEQLHERLRQVLGAELIVGVPNRDFFVAVSLNHPELIGQIQQRVVQDYHSMHHPLTNRLLVISADGVSEYCES